jgi:hypothetical protein
MNSPAPFSALQPESLRSLHAALLSHFAATQNPDGGWAFHAGGRSRVEPSCWAIRALAGTSESARSNISRGLAFLKAQQLSDGSWPAASGIPTGGWVTSLAAGVLAQFPPRDKQGEKSVHAALEWLCDDYPRDSSRWQKFLKSFSSAKHESHNDEFRGWGWTPRTSSWVEPTSFALLAFSSVAPSVVPGSKPEPGSFDLSPQLAQRISDRRALAVGLLYDRMCAGGGWNCGNPRVYGVDGESLVLPTCWALLALRNGPEHPNRALSLAWLQKSFATIASAGSFAVAQITLETYGVPTPTALHHLTDFSAADLAGQGTHVAAWSALALNPYRTWPSSFHELPVTSHPSQP